MQITAKDWSVCSVPHCPPHMRRVQCVRVDVRIPIRRDCRAEIGNRAISLAQAATQCQGKPAKTGIRDISFPFPFPLSCANYSSSSGLLHTEIWTAHLRPSRARGGTRSNGPPSYRRTGRVRQYHSCAASVPPCDIGRAGSFSCLDGGPLRCSCGMRRARLAGSLALVVSDSVSASVVVRARAVGHRPVVCSPTDVAIVGSVPWIAACQFPAWLALIHRSSLCMKQAHRNINITSRRVYNIHFSTAHVCTHT